MLLTNEEAQFINKLKVSNPSITEQESRGQNNNPLLPAPNQKVQVDKQQFWFSMKTKS